ncbi:MAG: hypothetical protein HETSPECPRED_007412 [Heterodermia speciosa]|uniref:Uncharacterized protein n=1 Tax=Heterodermia speciosa TaxID=116794 RepID=A0A8H3FS34_9LECA|nr:MAG: hypothetical protein HETSPECPRED_007412 [Heterodermia speciosa]
MRITAVVPLLFSLIAFILSLLCVFAGSKRGYLENGDLLTLNTSMLGRLTLNTSSSHSSLLNSIESSIKGDINGLVADVAKKLNIHDFYSAHILDYCEGFYTPSAVANLTAHPSKNVTKCSNQTATFHFDPAKAIQDELKPGINLTDLKWPSKVQDGLTAVKLASNVMFVLYCIGIAAIGVALIGALIGVFAAGRFAAMINTMLSFLAFFALMLASAISTGVIVKVTDVVNKHGNDIGLAAYQGKTFLGMTWAATILALLTSFVWFAEIIIGRRRQA